MINYIKKLLGFHVHDWQEIPSISKTTMSLQCTKCGEVGSRYLGSRYQLIQQN